mgnify:CR=1 FL=1
MPQVMFNLRQALAYCDPVSGAEQIARLRRASAFMESLQADLLYGSTVHNVRAGVTAVPGIADLFLSDGCVSAPMYYTDAECATFMDGLLPKSGLRAGLSEYLVRVVQGAADREVSLASPNCTWSGVSAGDLSLARYLGDKYLPPGFTASADAFRANGEGDITDFVAADTAVTIVSVLALAFFYALVYLPAISALDREIKTTRGLLLLFPDAVARTVPAITAAGRDLLRDTGGVDTGSSGSSAII